MTTAPRLDEPPTGRDAPSGGEYYRRVADYYDIDARNFEARSRQNYVLQRLRDEFRRESAPYARGRILEIGFGPGFDLAYWARACPTATVVGIDVSPGMVACAEARLRAENLPNARAVQGTIEEVPRLFPDERFDLVYCYFGALNTTEDLQRAADGIGRVLAPGGAAVLTFVNRWYLMEIVYGLLRLRWQRAFARLRTVWGGYANDRTLESRCVSPGAVRAAFGSRFRVADRRGYCLLYPAWYRDARWVRGYPRLAEALWRADRLLNWTPLWSTGEYALYVLRPRPGST